MNRLIKALVLLIAMNTVATAQKTISGLLKKYNNDSEVLAFNMQGDMLNLFEAIDGEDIQSKMESIEVLMFNKDKDITNADKEKLKQIANEQGFETLINARHEGNKIRVYALDAGDYVSKLFATVNGETHNIYVIVEGKIHYDEIMKLNEETFTKMGRFKD